MENDNGHELKKSQLLDEIRKDLRDAPPIQERASARQLIQELTKEIQSQLKSGRRLREIHTIINARLPADRKISFSTFSKYQRLARRPPEHSNAQTTFAQPPQTPAPPAHGARPAAATPTKAPLETALKPQVRPEPNTNPRPPVDQNSSTQGPLLSRPYGLRQGGLGAVGGKEQGAAQAEQRRE